MAVRFIHVQNDARLRKAGTFIQLLETVKTDDPNEATFYAHAKGVSRARTVHAVEKKWAECMYHYCLDFPERVASALAHKAMYGVSFELEKLWIYPGTFWWFHNATLFARPDWNVLSNPVTKEGIGWSVEAFPNRFFSARLRARSIRPSCVIRAIRSSASTTRESGATTCAWPRSTSGPNGGGGTPSNANG